MGKIGRLLVVVVVLVLLAVEGYRFWRTKNDLVNFDYIRWVRANPYR